METAFYIVGGSLCLLALIISAIGMRNDDFPSPRVLRLGVLLVALVVVGAGYTAVNASLEEEEARELEENELAAEEATEIEAENAEEAGGGSSSGTQEEDPASGGGVGDEESVTAGGGASDTEAGAIVFANNGCGSCHTLADQGDQALGQIGPNLDTELVDETAAYIETSIVDPSDEIVEGFGDNIMPDDYGEIIPPEDLDALVAYLDQVSGASGSAK